MSLPSLTAGPPLLPGFKAASIWIRTAEELLAIPRYSIRETTPCVIESCSPPTG